MRILVFGPCLEKRISGTGWVKHNIIKALANSHDVTSVTDSSDRQSTNMKIIKSLEERGTSDYNIPEVTINGVKGWDELVKSMKPDIVIAVGDPEKCWFTSLAEGNHKSFFYYISEGKTLNRYIKTNHNDKWLDLKLLFDCFTKIIPATPTTAYAMWYDLGIDEDIIPDYILPPTWKWDVSNEAAIKYRRSINIMFDEKLFYCITTNNERKRLDQLLIFFAEHLKKKPCNRLVIHTDAHKEGGYNIMNIAHRLGITDNVIINQKRDLETMKGIMSAGDVYVSMPAAEGYGLPLFEALLLGKPCYHSGVGFIGSIKDSLGGSPLNIVEAKHPYFYRNLNQIWYSIGKNPKIINTNYNNKTTLAEVTNTVDQFQDKICKELNL